ncbi:MAG: transglutaminase domain-containing protein [Pontiellaceae bacterium]|nr:transglutaminase domain-containing protein [Pontiellaceae bacterium]MBN2785401.1 transglutaminase domain-containing protein [Pontiellaceae bacterium]
MESDIAENSAEFSGRRMGRPDVRALTTDERASFLIVSLYMITFCIASFVYWDFLLLRILGVTSAVAGIFLFFAAFFNTEGKGTSNSIHPLRSYLISFFLVLTTLFVLRLVGGLISDPSISVVVLYGGIAIALIAFRKALVQVISAMLVLVFLFVTFHNLPDIMSGRMGVKDSIRQCGQAIFQIGPIQDVSNMLMAGPYVAYLNHIDYRNEQINTMASRLVAHSNDDDLKKTRILLDYVSNDIYYVSDPDDGLEYTKSPITTLVAGAGDCDDQAVLLCSLLESVGVKTFIAFTDDHVFLLVQFPYSYNELKAEPHVYIDGKPCYALDPADPGAYIGRSAAKPEAIRRVFDARSKSMQRFSLSLSENT